MREGAMSVDQALEFLDRAIPWVAAYERHVFPDQLRAMSAAVSGLQAALQRMGSLSHRAMVKHAYALECADEARLYLAAYAPYGQSSDIRHLRLRREVVQALAVLVQAVRVWVSVTSEE